ncbi:MAG: hypothetical protein ACXABY_34415 [Candidatus Thorarchaeota archaeon]|jgi:hypothetical protein
MEEPLIPKLRTLVVLGAIIGMLLGVPAFADEPDPTPTAFSIIEEYKEDLILPLEQIRIENSWKCGGSIHDCMLNETDALVLTRIAMGESPNSLDDRIATIWIIRLRAALGFKNAKHYGPYNEYEDRWGHRSSIKEEALCIEGCQFEVVRSAKHLYAGCHIPKSAYTRSMYCPTDQQLGDFWATYIAARYILGLHITEMPEFMWGYDGFRSPQISWYGRIDWKGGLPSRAFYPQGNVWRDEYPKDNVYWEGVIAGFTPTPLPTFTPTATETPLPTATALPTATKPAVNPQARIQATEAVTKEEAMLQEPWATLLFLLVVPLLIQGYKMWREKAGGVPPKAIVVQIVLFGVSFVFIFFNEGVLGWPLPVWEGNVLAFISAWGTMISTLFALTMALYEVVYKAVMEKVKFATKAALTGILLLFR